MEKQRKKKCRSKRSYLMEGVGYCTCWLGVLAITCFFSKMIFGYFFQ